MKKKEHVDSTANVLKKKTFRQGLPVFNDNAAGIDVGDTMYDVAISNGANGYEVRKYAAFTEDLISLVEWLKSAGITTVAMESEPIPRYKPCQRELRLQIALKPPWRMTAC